MEKNENSHQRRATIADKGTRLDRFWARELEKQGVSRGRVRGWIESGCATVDGRTVTKGKLKLEGDELLCLTPPETAEDAERAEPQAGPLDIIHEDPHLVVVDKPAGLTVHPAPGEPDDTLVNRLLARFPDMKPDISGMDGLRPGIVHRLDKDTSGVMAVARNEAARLKLAEDFAERRTAKHYLAIVHGVPSPSTGEIDAPMGRHPSQKTKMAVVDKGGRDARSDYEVLETSPDGSASLVLVRIHTGRTHQIRVHMAHIGHPLVGDRTYGSRHQADWDARGYPEAGRQMLHAFHLCIDHPDTGERMRFSIPPHKDFITLLTTLNDRATKVGITGMPGSGKSYFSRLLHEAGHPVFSADESVAKLYASGGDGAEMIRGRFGGRYTAPDGSVDKQTLFRAMLESDALRREVMEMVHPMVRHDCREFFRRHADAAFAFAEIPLLLESGWHRNGLVDLSVCVHCDQSVRTGRFRKERGLSSEMLATFDSWQWPEQDKLEACDMVVNNPGTPEGMQQSVESFLNDLTRRRRETLAAVGERLASLWPELAHRFGEEDR
ncbi:dephospho-CoA kinase [Desulfovibrio oxyclinae]|uniref:dephospho-CoA kinase n=1 Tax=Desulfovibrio oxyclinae TaxID=63560 RepID=UPI00036EB366|nr:dephospho-CoA kinase [Desulfovibrio oxyclinae]